MEARSGLTSEELLQTVCDLMDAGGGFNPEQPVVLSCGGIQLRGRKVPKNLGSWQTQIFLPHPRRSSVRTVRMRGESTRKSLERILQLESFN